MGRQAGAAAWLVVLMVQPAAEAASARAVAAKAASKQDASTAPTSPAASAASPAVDAQRAAVMRQAQALLAAGQPDAASDAFEHAVAMRHDSDAELGLVRAAMQAGRYRQALNLAAHVAGGHADEADGVALYAWLLQAGGQGAAALRVIGAKGVALPAAPLPPLAVSDALASGLPIPANVRMLGGAVLVAGGRQALMAASILAAVPDPGTLLWVRNRLGQVRAAHVLQRDAITGVTLLDLAAPLPWPAAVSAAVRAPFPGSPGFTAGYALQQDGHAAWPRMEAGFFGKPRNDGLQWPLGIGLAPGVASAAVFDRFGNVAGIAIATDAGGVAATDFVALARLPDTSGSGALPGTGAAGAAPVPATTAAEPASVELVYERALRVSLQVLAVY